MGEDYSYCKTTVNLAVKAHTSEQMCSGRFKEERWSRQNTCVETQVSSAVVAGTTD